MKTQLSFYFDYVSHNAYLAWTQLPHIAKNYQLKITAIPVLFAGLLNHYGQLGPAEVLPKIRWMTKDVMRKARLLRIPLKPPASHPFNPLLALRASSLPLDEGERSRLINALFEATWARSLDVSSPDVVASVASEIGLDGRDLVERATTVDAKNALAEQTKCAIEAGVFGVPTMVLDQELFWGFDNLAHVELLLKEEDPLDAQEYARWLNVQPSSQRKRP